MLYISESVFDVLSPILSKKGFKKEDIEKIINDFVSMICKKYGGDAYQLFYSTRFTNPVANGIVECLFLTLKKYNCVNEIQTICDTFRDEFFFYMNACQTYIGKNIKSFYKKRDKEIIDSFYKEPNLRGIGKKYGLTPRRIYQILKSYEDKQNRNKNNDK